MDVRTYVRRWCGCTGCVLIHATLSLYDVNVCMYVRMYCTAAPMCILYIRM